MAPSVLVDASYLVAFLSATDSNHRWAIEQATRLPPRWMTCEAVVSETFYLLGRYGSQSFASLLRRGAVLCSHSFADNVEAVLRLKDKYADVPMSFADACLVRMTETLDDPILLTMDRGFRIYRRHGRQVIPCVLPT
jgi:predicted nucleic acid-binding protein